MEPFRSRAALEPQVRRRFHKRFGSSSLGVGSRVLTIGGAFLAPLIVFAHTNDVVLMRVIPEVKSTGQRASVEVVLDASAHPVLRHVENPVKMVAESVFVVDGAGRTAPLSASRLQQRTLRVRTGGEVHASCPVPMTPEPGEPPSDWMSARWELSEVDPPARLMVSGESKLNVLVWVAEDGEVKARDGWGWVTADRESGLLPFPEGRLRWSPAVVISVFVALVGLVLNGVVLIRRKTLFPRSDGVR